MLKTTFEISSGDGKLPDMNTAQQPNVKFVQTPDYREAYSNSVQIRVNVWDFFLVFGTMQQSSETQVELHNFQGIYLSPQQAKALMALLQQNVANYEVRVRRDQTRSARSGRTCSLMRGVAAV